MLGIGIDDLLGVVCRRACSMSEPLRLFGGVASIGSSTTPTSVLSKSTGASTVGEMSTIHGSGRTPNSFFMKSDSAVGDVRSPALSAN